MPVHNFKKLEVWKKSRLFVKDIYVVSAKFPPDERFGIISQIRRAVISISLNISEGSGRGTNKDFSHFLDTSFSSALEVENLIFLCFDLDYIVEEKQKELINKVTEIQKMIRGLQGTLGE